MFKFFSALAAMAFVLLLAFASHKGVCGTRVSDSSFSELAMDHYEEARVSLPFKVKKGKGSRYSKYAKMKPPSRIKRSRRASYRHRGSGHSVRSHSIHRGRSYHRSSSRGWGK